jgi:hypothetical protein
VYKALWCSVPISGGLFAAYNTAFASKAAEWEDDVTGRIEIGYGGDLRQ